MNHKTRIFFQILSYLTLILMFTTLAFLFYWNIKTYTPIDFSQTPFEVLTKEVKQGGYLTYRINYCKDNNLVPDVTRSFVDGIIYNLPGDTQPYFKNGCHSVDVKMYVPKALPEGTYHLAGTYRFEVNPIRHIDIFTKTEDFKVVSN